jgi:chromosomal replication initiation ATPase DnaA
VLKVSHPLVAKAAKVLELPRSALVNKRRFAYLAQARWAVMVTLRNRGWPLTRIGHVLGGRDHSTVLSGLARAESLLATDAEFAALVRRIEAVL